ncbi:MAG: TerB family tellurite resistance protein [Aquisalinus sp.]|nr:TerB family tellurite resistance protein [Aquisalinus sp.]
MLDRILQKLAGNQKQADTEDAPDAGQLAYTALLVEAARIDQNYTDTEAALIDKLIRKEFALDAEAATTLRTEAEKAQEEAIDIYRFSSVVKNEFSTEEKIELLEGMWEIILSDNESDKYEEMIVRRLIGLIYISDQDSAKARKRVEARISEQS